MVFMPGSLPRPRNFAILFFLTGQGRVEGEAEILAQARETVERLTHAQPS